MHNIMHVDDYEAGEQQKKNKKTKQNETCWLSLGVYEKVYK